MEFFAEFKFANKNAYQHCVTLHLIFYAKSKYERSVVETNKTSSGRSIKVF